MMMNDMTMTKK